MTVSGRPADRPSRWRRAAVAVATATALLAPVAPLPALAPAAVAAPQVRAEETPAPEYWFGEPIVRSYYLGDTSLFTDLSFEHPEQTNPLPFHSFVVGRLYDCRGRVAHTRYASLTTEQHGSGPWRSRAGLDLSVPRAGGPFARWKVTVQAKGRKPVHLAVTDGGPGLQLGCDGEYRRARDLAWWPHLDPKRPINAKFGTPVAKLMRTHVGRFGRVAGSARVGAKVRVVGARDPRGNPACGLNVVIPWPKRPSDTWVEGVGCDAWVRVPKTIGDYGPQGRLVKTPTRGKRLRVHVTFSHKGHTFERITDLGLIR